MKQGTVKFSKEFITPIGLKEWAGIEYPVDFDTDNIQEAFNYAKGEVMKSQASSPGFSDNSIPLGPPPIIQVQQQEVRIGVLVEDIISCKELAVLDSYRLMVRGSEELTAAYNKRRSEIVGTEVNEIIKRADELTPKTKIDKKHNGKAL